jgi:hypothetical protein
MPNLKAVRHEAGIDVPVPYLRWDDSSIILIAANRRRDGDATLKLKVDLTATGLGGRKSYLVTDLWSNAAPMTLTEKELAGFRCVVKRDGAAGGGIAVFRIHPA